MLSRARTIERSEYCDSSDRRQTLQRDSTTTPLHVIGGGSNEKLFTYPLGSCSVDKARSATIHNLCC